MCEPNHSIVQFPDEDDRGNPTGPMIDAIPTNAEGFFSWAKKKVKSWFHFSKVGKGHSEAMATMNIHARHRLPDDTKYEGRWWERKVVLDGSFNGMCTDITSEGTPSLLGIRTATMRHGTIYEMMKAEAIAAATEYAHKVSIGNMTLLRQFLEQSMLHTENQAGYIDTFPMMLNAKGKDVLTEKVKRQFRINLSDMWRFGRDSMKAKAKSLMPILFWFTRQRKLLVPEWADDAAIWTPPEKKIILA